jgi:hypothetical protein
VQGDSDTMNLAWLSYAEVRWGWVGAYLAAHGLAAARVCAYSLSMGTGLLSAQQMMLVWQGTLSLFHFNLMVCM